MSQVQLEFKSVTKRFRNPNDANLESITAIEGVTLRVKDGEVVSLIGPSGCDKSTLQNLAFGLDQPCSLVQGATFADFLEYRVPSLYASTHFWTKSGRDTSGDRCCSRRDGRRQHRLGIPVGVWRGIG